MGPDHALDVGGLELAVHAEDGAVAVDGDLGVEERVAAWDSLRDAEVDGYAGAAAGFLDGSHVVAVGFDYDAFFGVFGEGGDLLEGRVTFDEVLIGEC